MTEETPHDVVTFTYEGQSFTFHHPVGDHIGQVQARRKTFYELDLLEALRERLRDRPGYVIDVGAHVGNHMVYFSRVMNRKVLAFEPFGRNEDYLRVNCKDAGDAVRVLGLGLNSTNRHMRYIPPPKGNSGMVRLALPARDPMDDPEPALYLPTVNFDDFVADNYLPEGPCALMKIDVEGMEVDVLEGADEFINNHRPIIAMEAQNNAALDLQEAWFEQSGIPYVRSKQRYCATPTYIWESL